MGGKREDHSELKKKKTSKKKIQKKPLNKTKTNRLTTKPYWGSKTYTLRTSMQRGTAEGTEFKHSSFPGCCAALSEWFQVLRIKSSQTKS